ncbi:MAG: tRNA uridine-5-carboxymethylaminomethyl(34) synthesis GTPase MnmE [Verrucomicrobia bacterium]|nr:tRNA uridine-5-carboxymethylaminomethyl(34) synthesis GTPase MnmE [Verrucomicrobiota bacterium]
MHFNHRPFQKNDTIAAVATPPGEGAIAVIRVSGKEAIDVAEKVFTGKVRDFKTHTAHYGHIVSALGETIDGVLLLVMRAPRSYTGEDTVEIQCHGGSIVTRRVLERILEAGARAAQPGEFSLQAFLNGKLDLAQAEAVQQLIAARNELALQAAEQQLQGALSKAIGGFQQGLTETVAILEAWVDFPEEGLEFATMDELIGQLEETLGQMRHLQATFQEGKTIHQGLSLCLAGSPNVGKSSLMNALLGKERAIVTEIAGTTRDLLEDDLRLSGLHFRLIDTAGIRDTEEIVEKEGIRRSKSAMQSADLILFLLDASRPLSESDRTLLESVPREKTILVWNKIDLQKPSETIEWTGSSASISAKERIGLDELKGAIDQLIWRKGPPSKEEIVITQQRHFQALGNAIDSCQTAIDGLKQGISPEFVSSDLRNCLNELGMIIGTNISEDILTSIFSKFCLGK